MEKGLLVCEIKVVVNNFCVVKWFLGFFLFSSCVRGINLRCWKVMVCPRGVVGFGAFSHLEMEEYFGGTFLLLLGGYDDFGFSHV